MAGYSDLFLDEAVNAGLVDAASAADIKEEHERTGKPTRELVLEQGLMDAEQVLDLTAQYLGAERVDIEHMTIPLEVQQAIPGSVARMYNVMPVAFDGTTVTLATCEMLSPEVSDEIAFVTGHDVLLAVSDGESISAAIARYYGAEDTSMQDVISSMEGELAESGEISAESGAKTEDLANVEAAANSRPVVRFVNLVLYQAVQDRASDIHFEPFENEFKIRYRVDGAIS